MKILSQRDITVIDDPDLVKELDLIHKNINLIQNFSFKRINQDYDASIKDNFILMVQAGVTVKLPIVGLFSGYSLIIKDISGSVSSSNSTISTGTSATIDGNTSLTISTNYDVIRLFYDGSNWFEW